MTATLLDEPATLAVGQAVRIVVDDEDDARARAQRWAYLDDPARDVANMTDEEMGEWLEIVKHQLRGVPYDHHAPGGVPR